jgi:hypothetical protein
LNTGDWNTGNCSTGNWNTGNLNTGNLNTGDLNTTKPETVRLFNKKSDWKFHGEKHNKLKDIIWKYQKPLCEWISKANMTEQEIKDNPTCETTQGYLKVNKGVHKDIEISEEDKKFLLSVPNFDNDILKECTGIDLENQKIKITMDGCDKFISKDEFETLKKMFCDKS